MHGIPTRREFTAGLAGLAAASLAGRRASAVAAEAEGPLLAAPVAPALRATFAAFGRQRIDEYDCRRNHTNRRVFAYLASKTASAPPLLKPIKPLVDELAAELKARSAHAD